MIGRTSSPCSSRQETVASPTLPQRLLIPLSKTRHRAQAAALVFACLALPGSQCLSQQIEYRTLPQLIEGGVASFTQGDFASSANAFNYIVENYAEEPAWLNSSLPSKLLPLAGFASLKSSQYTAAISALELYLADYASDASAELFARYALAISLHRDNQTDKAKSAFAQLRADAGESAFRDLAAIREAKLSDPETAIKLYTEVANHPVSLRLGYQARLELIRLALEAEQPDIASNHLINTKWQEAKMPEIASLSFLAFQVGDRLLESNPADALRAYRLVSPKSRLIRSQETRIAELKDTVATLAPTLAATQSIWTDFYRESLAAMEQQLSALRSTPDYADALDLRKARCFASVHRPVEAWLLLESLSLKETEIAPAAHLEWIEVARQMQSWNAAALIAQNYVETYPNRDDATIALYWIAQSQIEQGSYQEALASLATLKRKTEEASLLASANYFSGFCRYQLGDHILAIDSFRKAAKSNPDASIAGQATLWIGICQFTTNDLEAAIDTFLEVEESPTWLFLHPEAAYRKAACLYALGETERAKASIEHWLAAYPNHVREAEARLLHGDLLRDSGLVREAIEAYEKVSPNDRELRFFALSNKVELLDQLEAWPEAIASLAQYQAAAPVPQRLAGDFYSLYAHCLRENGQPGKADNALKDAVHSYGNQLNAVGILKLIESSDSFNAQTLARQITLETESNKPTLAARYTLAFANLLETTRHVSESKLQKLRLVSDFSIDTLPPECLETAGAALSEIGSIDAPKYFERIIEKFPDSDAKALAYFGLAKHHASTPATALAYLSEADSTLLPPSDSIQATLLQANLEFENGSLEAASNCFQSALAERQASPNAKAQALFGLGEIQLALDQPRDAYAYFQRIFTLYRGEEDLVAKSYLRCAEILSSENRYTDVEKICSEFLSQTQYASFPSYREAEDLLKSLPSQTDESAIQ